jgi:hypothetical protein
MRGTHIGVSHDSADRIGRRHEPRCCTSGTSYKDFNCGKAKRLCDEVQCAEVVNTGRSYRAEMNPEGSGWPIDRPTSLIENAKKPSHWLRLILCLCDSFALKMRRACDWDRQGAAVQSEV